MAKNPESPLEPFKRALAHAARSLAESPDLEIVYSGEGPQLSGNRAGEYSVRINRQYRICFRWSSAGLEDVEITDYH